jgi:hypothetical protein
VALHLGAPYTISDISGMPDAPVHDAGPPLIEAFVWLVVPLAFFLSLIWAGAVLAAIVKGRGFERRERIPHARKAGELWLHSSGNTNVAVSPVRATSGKTNVAASRERRNRGLKLNLHEEM